MIELDRENQSKNGHAQIKCRELPRSISAGTNQTREINQLGVDTRISYDAENFILIQNVAWSQLGADDFRFV
ncbi:hypothetical protein D0C28_18225 [Rhizobium sp. AU243]|nr:hypothetical protein D0C28_18225 [Rhizobium sp. AU243]